MRRVHEELARHAGTAAASVANKAREWLDGTGDQELSDWDISRDAPYFGIPIPDAPGKFFYVWLDAPVGYLASLKNYFDTGKARANGEQRSFEEFLAAPEVEQIHFIGKDIIYFHTLFWPAMLQVRRAARCPTTSTCTASSRCPARRCRSRAARASSPLRYLELGMNPEWLRYYIAAKLNANVEDIDFNPDDFVARVNSDLVGKYVNIASRTAGFITKRFGGRLARARSRGARAGARLPERRAVLVAHRPALRGSRVRQGAARDRRAARPRESVHRREQALGARQGRRRAATAARGVLHEHCNFFWYLTVLLRPVLPETARRVAATAALERCADAVGPACQRCRRATKSRLTSI